MRWKDLSWWDGWLSNWSLIYKTHFASIFNLKRDQSREPQSSVYHSTFMEVLWKSRHDVIALHACEGGFAAKDTVMNFNRASLSLRETYFLLSFVSLFIFSLPVQLHFPWEAYLFYTVRPRTWPLYLHRALQFSRLWPCQKFHVPFQMQPLQLLPAWGHSRSALLAGDYTWDPKSLSRHYHEDNLSPGWLSEQKQEQKVKCMWR